MSLRRAVRVAAFVVAIASIVAVATAPAHAHAALVSASPAPGASLAQAPGAVVLRFSEPVDLRTSTVAVTGVGERDATSGLTGAVPGDGRSIRRSLRLLHPGRYTVRWTSVSSDDGHIETGSYTFAIGVASSSVRHLDAGLFAGENTTALIGRLVSLVGLALWGGLLVVANAARRSGISLARLGALERGATAAASMGALLVLVDRVASSPVGSATLVAGRPEQLDGIVLLAAVVGVWSTRRRTGMHRRVGLVAASVAIAAEVASGHAAVGSVPVLTTAVLAFHLLAVGVWAATIMTSLLSRHVVRTLKTMSRYAVVAAGMVLVTGAVATITEVRRLSALTTTTYGLLVVAKIAVFFVVVAAGLLHWRRRRSRSAQWRLRIPLRVEALAAGTAIALGAVLSGAPPPSSPTLAAIAHVGAAGISARPDADAVSVAGASGPLVVGLTIAPPRPGRARAEVQVLGAGSADPPRTVRVSGAAPRSQGFDVALHPERFATFGGTLPIDGRGLWTITVSVATGRRSAHVDFRIPLPTPCGRADLARALLAEEQLTSVQLHESVRADTDGRAVVADYVFRAPDRLEFTTDGTTEIDVGKRTFRRDRPGRPWSAQRTDAAVAWPSPYFRQLWGAATTARIVGTGVVNGVASDIVAFARPDLPAWFRLWVGHDGLVRREEMLAEGHLMVHTYFDFDDAPPIAAPSTGASGVTSGAISQ